MHKATHLILLYSRTQDHSLDIDVFTYTRTHTRYRRNHVKRDKVEISFFLFSHLRIKESDAQKLREEYNKLVQGMILCRYEIILVVMSVA